MSEEPLFNREVAMPTLLSHPAVPIAISMAVGSTIIPGRLLAAGILASVLPDLDLIGLRMGIPYGDAFGHRGASHSIFVAVFFGIIAAIFSKQLHCTKLIAFVIVTVAGASHAVLDMLTNGGGGVALLWPLTEQRYFFEVRVIEVAPLSVRRLLGPAGWQVLKSEILWVWLPAIVAGVVGGALFRGLEGERKAAVMLLHPRGQGKNE